MTVPAAEVATTATAPVLDAPRTKPTVAPTNQLSRALPAIRTDHPRVFADRGSSINDAKPVSKRVAPALKPSGGAERNSAADHRTALADRRAVVADRRAAAAEHRNEAPQNTVFATAQKLPAVAVAIPPCNLSNLAEAAVCASPALNALRRQVHELYVGVGTDGDPKLIAKAQREQASFLKHRDRCKDNACLNRQYKHQIEALQKLRTKAAATRVRAAAKALPTCVAGQRPSLTLCRPAHHRISLKKLLGIKHA